MYALPCLIRSRVVVYLYHFVDYNDKNMITINKQWSLSMTQQHQQNLKGTMLSYCLIGAYLKDSLATAIG